MAAHQHLGRSIKRAKARIKLTQAAEEQLRRAMIKQDGNCQGIRLSVREAGCSGLEYVMDFTERPDRDDYVATFEGFAVFIDAASYETALDGLTLDYQEDAISSGFVFQNPNKKGECGCGASFSV